MSVSEEFLASFQKKASRKIKKDPKSEYKKQATQSNFIVTLDPKFSNAQIDSRPKLLAAIGKLNTWVNHLKNQSTNGEWLKQKGRATARWTHPRLVKFNPELERGEQTGKLHVHVLLSFDGTCHMDLAKLRAYSRSHFGKVPHLDVRFFQNAEKVMQAYIKKTTNTANTANTTSTTTTPSPSVKNYLQPRISSVL